jgi:hypothetical protein
VIISFSLFTAGCGGSGRSAGVAGANKTSSQRLVGAGSTLVAPLVAQWQNAFKTATGVTVDYGTIGSGGGIQRPGSRMPRLRADPVGARRDDPLVQPPRPIETASAERAGDRPDVPRPDHGLERPADRQAQPGREVALDRRAPGVPERCERRHIRLHRLPVPRQSRLEIERRWCLGRHGRVAGAEVDRAGLDFRQLAHRHRGEQELRCRRCHREDAGSDRVPRDRRGRGRQAPLRVQNRGKAFVLPSSESIAAAAKTARFGKDNSASIVDPPASAKTVYPISTFTYVIMRRSSSKATTLRKFVTYAVTTGQN